MLYLHFIINDFMYKKFVKYQVDLRIFKHLFIHNMTKIKDCVPAMGTGALMGFMVGGGMAGGVSNEVSQFLTF